MKIGTLPFLRIPPFPGHRGTALSQPGNGQRRVIDTLLERLKETRVGGNFWGAQPDLPADATLLMAPADTRQWAAMRAAAGDRPAVVMMAGDSPLPPRHTRLPVTCDPWHLVAQVDEIWAGADQEIALVAQILGRKPLLFGASNGIADPTARLMAELGDQRFFNPFTGAEWTAEYAIAQLAAWRHLIDANRALHSVYGIAAWKRTTLTPLLWNGAGPVPYRRAAPRPLPSGAQVALWASRSPKNLVDKLRAQGARIGEIEDGFIRSIGLGANCVPPLSAIVDFSGIYFDPSRPSDLETLLEITDFPDALCVRAAQLRAKLVASAISKYGAGGSPAVKPGNGRKVILVPGQVEDDRSVQSGGLQLTNLDLLARARACAPDAYLIYKPHPDVEAGHRKGYISQAQALCFADDVRYESSIISLIDICDALHVLTSLSGFEALLRGKPVTTHGIPFYAGWGLTQDLAPMPARRTRQRSLDELVAATLLLYPRYLDPVTRLPCPAEILVERLAQGDAQIRPPLVRLREAQGQLIRGLRQVRRHLPW